MVIWGIGFQLELTIDLSLCFAWFSAYKAFKNVRSPAAAFPKSSFNFVDPGVTLDTKKLMHCYQ